MSSRRALEALLRLYPADFRASFGDEMLDVFAVQCEEIRRERGVTGLLLLWLRTLPGVLRSAWLERVSPDGPNHRLPRKRRNPMDTLIQDIRYGLRALTRSPGFAAVAVLTVALGIGVNTVIFSMVNAMILRPLPGVEAPSQLVVMFTGEGGSVGVSSYMDYVDFAARNRTLQGLAAYKVRAADFTVDEGTERITGMLVTDNYFDVLGVTPHLGRFFGAADNDEPGAETVAVLSHELWQTALGADPGVVGTTVRINGLTYTVIGVAPPQFRGTTLDSRPQLFVPMMMQPLLMPSSGMLLDSRGWGGILTVGRLADGTTLQQARDDFRGIGEWLHETYPQQVGSREYSLAPLAEATLSPDDRDMAMGLSTLLLGAVGIVLLVACVNVANLMLSRALRRRSEIAVRQALGAGRGRLIRQLLVESLTLSVIGGIVGLAFAFVARGFLEAMPIPFELDYGFDARILGFAAVITLLTGFAFGVIPALAATRADLASPMRQAAAGSSGRSINIGGALVVAQVAMSLVLLIAAGLFTRTFIEIGSSDLGFEPDNLLVVAVDPSLQGYGNSQADEYYRRLMEQFEEIPGVQSASLASVLPASGSDSLSFNIQGLTTEERLRTGVIVSGPRYFETMGIRMIRGRDFTAADSADAESVIIVNEAGIRRLSELVQGDPMDARISFRGPEGPFSRIVGIAADSKTGSLRSEPQPMAYAPVTQVPPGFATYTVLARATQVSPQSLVPNLRGVLHDVDPNVPAFRVGTLSEYLATTLVQERLLAGLVGFAAVLTLALASVGLYGILSFAVARRTREMGIRLAMGANAASVRYLVVRQALFLVVIGGGLGVMGSLAMGSLLSGFLYGVTATDPMTYAVVIGMLVAVALAASYVPARRATRVDPLVALRAD